MDKADFTRRLSDPKTQAAFIEIFKSLLSRRYKSRFKRREFSRASLDELKSLNAYLGVADVIDINPVDSWQETLQATIGACWQKMLEYPDSLRKLLDNFRRRVSAGEAEDIDMPLEAAAHTLALVLLDAKNHSRDKDFASLRKVIANLSENGEPVFCTKNSAQFLKKDIGMLYAPFGTEETLDCSLFLDADSIPPGLGEADRDIRLSRKTPEERGGGVAWVWNGEVVGKEASRFWRAWVDAFCEGKAAFVPEYALYRWISRRVNVGRPIETDVDDTVDEGAFEDKKPAVEMEILAGEVAELAKGFARSLPEREARVCALLYEEGATMERAARDLGLGGASAITRLKNNLLRRFREFMSQFEEFEDDEIGELFVMAVIKECKSASRPININE